MTTYTGCVEVRTLYIAEPTSEDEISKVIAPLSLADVVIEAAGDVEGYDYALDIPIFDKTLDYALFDEAEKLLRERGFAVESLDSIVEREVAANLA